jgi:hypothetical protein
MKRYAAAIVVLVATVTVGSAQYKDMMKTTPSESGSRSASKITIKGYLVDKNCAYHAADMAAIGATHTTSCALGTEGATLGVIQNGVFYPFDEKGTKKAVELLRKSKLTRGVMVQASGNMEGSAFVVAKLQELKPSDD